MLHVISIRRGLFLPLLAAASPLRAVLGLAIYNEYRTKHREAERLATRIAEVTAAETREFIADVRTHLAGARPFMAFCCREPA